MQFITSRSEALDKLDQYVEKNISNYNTKRNFDFGVTNRSNVSCLSPYITHRLITEYETAKIVLKKLIGKNEMGTTFKVLLATNKSNNFNLGIK